ncbi:ERI1 exoribonuclease 2-like isoform X3 [Limulus polyphemus]|uniref:ERI1 exoribonuclease 2-like isoform X3 n=1 Tax=Limulus polyphemus TaxID=6850 RepID=A0ABM1T2X4_LIMPO|nr:ERI1 exoribonuclease 2-like isoform X3 [Limulus polyphemus]
MATKKLAKELGLLRQHNGKKKQEMDTQHSRSEKEKGQFFDYLIVIDFESTCWEDKGKAHLCQEIIEFPAVFLNLVTGDIIEQFHTYIQPREHPKLSDFCQKLTGISQKFYSRTPNGLRGAIEDLGLCFEGREHSGIVDSMNTAKLAFKMAQDGCYLNITHSDTLVKNLSIAL